MKSKDMNIWKKFTKFFNDIEEKQYEKNIAENNQEDVLVINNKNSIKGKYKVYDNNGNLKYNVKGKTISHKPYLNIYNKFGKKIAIIQQEKRSSRLYYKHDLIFKIANRQSGVFNQKLNILKRTYSLDNGWNINTNVFKGKYEIKNSNKIIATIFQCGKYEEKISFEINENELLILMVTLSISMYNIIDEKYMKMVSKDGSGC